MDKNRMMELLNEIVNYVQIGKDIPEIIDKLLDMGFTKEELIEYFDFDECDFLLWFIVRRNKTTKCYRNWVTNNSDLPF